jgi:IS1 family transposase
MDELWSYLKRKRHQLWVFISFEVSSRFWLGFELGSRTTPTANRLVAQFKRFGNWTGEKILKVTTDKLAAYRHWFRLIPMSPLNSFDLFFLGVSSIAYFTFKAGKSF